MKTKKENNSVMMEQYISIADCSEKLGLDRSHLLKNIKAGKYGTIKLHSQRDRNKQNQKVSVVTFLDFELIKRKRDAEGFGLKKPILDSSKGVFYIIQTNPTHIPNRYKFGFSSDIQNRLGSYWTICPNLKLIDQFHCNNIIERPLLNMISKYGKRIGQELYEVDDIEHVKNEIREVLKKLLPDSKQEVREGPVSHPHRQRRRRQHRRPGR